MDISGLLFCGLISFFKGERMYFGDFTLQKKIISVFFFSFFFC